MCGADSCVWYLSYYSMVLVVLWKFSLDCKKSRLFCANCFISWHLTDISQHTINAPLLFFWCPHWPSCSKNLNYYGVWTCHEHIPHTKAHSSPSLKRTQLTTSCTPSALRRVAWPLLLRFPVITAFPLLNLVFLICSIIPFTDDIGSIQLILSACNDSVL